MEKKRFDIYILSLNFWGQEMENDINSGMLLNKYTLNFGFIYRFMIKLFFKCNISINFFLNQYTLFFKMCLYCITPFDLINLVKTKKNCNFPILRQSITIINFSPSFLSIVDFNSRQRKCCCSFGICKRCSDSDKSCKELAALALKKGLKFQALFRKWFQMHFVKQDRYFFRSDTSLD